MIDVLMRTRGLKQPLLAQIDPLNGFVHANGRQLSAAQLSCDVPTTGTVYGVLFNFPATLAALGGAVNEAPYLAPPRAPVLYIKPVNTWIGAGMPIPLPPDVPAVRVGVTLGVVIGRTATRVSAARAFDHVAGYTVVNDISVPHDNYYRPPLRDSCRDGFCPIGPWIVPSSAVADPAKLTLRAYVNGELRQENTTGRLVRSIPRLLADITEFMTLDEGDVLMIGVPENPPLARVGDRVAVAVEGVGRLENPIVAEAELLGESR
ncbi:MAG TPA: fumarylacetoacetate hydrolase family protein [Steroidobacteraceae bacterium]|nr:fumarylacetoacetate hydrolase family protein [Steroidobacteraceae bacterium]